MNINRAMLKADARAAIRQSQTSPYLTALIYVLIIYVLGILETRITGVTIPYDVFLHALETGNTDYLMHLIQQQAPGPVPYTIGTLLSLMSAMIGIGFTIFTLLVYRRQGNTVGNLFDGFGNFFRFLWLRILIWIFTFLWSLLFFIPGIIAAYSYRQAIYILIDNPDMRAIDCISASKNMKGRKFELFLLDLSLLGWFLLSAIPFVSVYVFPYTNVTYAAYYITLLDINAGFGQYPPGGRPYGSSRYSGDHDDLPPWEFKN